MSSIKDISLAPSGAHKIDWVRKNCPLLRSLEEDSLRQSHLRASASRFPSIWRQKPLICARFWPPEERKCTSPGAILCPLRMT